jgi:hypothetical protein
MADKKDPWKESVFTPYAVVPARRPRNFFEAIPVYAKMKGKELLDTITSTYNTIDKVYKGEISPDSPEAIEAALTATMMTGTRGMATSGAVGGPGTTGMFIGKNATTFSKDLSKRALELAKEGKSAQEIWEATGTRRWKSGDRQEIPDNYTGFKDSYLKLPFSNEKLKNILDHPALYKAYPELEKTKVNVTDTLKEGYARFDPYSNEISISKADVDAKDTSTLLHEIQHWIQNKEGWQGGSSPSRYKTTKETLPSGEKTILTPKDKYYMSPGENEAIATENRRFMPYEQRSTRLPERDFEINWKQMFDFPSEI